jgi:hypothetical protein
MMRKDKLASILDDERGQAAAIEGLRNSPTIINTTVTSLGIVLNCFTVCHRARQCFTVLLLFTVPYLLRII